MSEPVRITDREAVALNHRLTTLFAGLGGGARDENLLRAALARPINDWHYDQPRPDLYDLAAAYAFAIARGHVFLDGDKRTAHAVAAVCLINNGIEHAAPKEEVVAAMIGVADGPLSVTELRHFPLARSRGASPLPLPTTHQWYPRGGWTGERAGAT